MYSQYRSRSPVRLPEAGVELRTSQLEAHLHMVEAELLEGRRRIRNLTEWETWMRQVYQWLWKACRSFPWFSSDDQSDLV